MLLQSLFSITVLIIHVSYLVFSGKLSKDGNVTKQYKESLPLLSSYSLSNFAEGIANAPVGLFSALSERVFHRLFHKPVEN
jgi:hypothetical protein